MTDEINTVVTEETTTDAPAVETPATEATEPAVEEEKTV